MTDATRSKAFGIVTMLSDSSGCFVTRPSSPWRLTSARRILGRREEECGNPLKDSVALA